LVVVLGGGNVLQSGFFCHPLANQLLGAISIAQWAASLHHHLAVAESPAQRNVIVLQLF
jgi:hypothetical protein